MSLYSYHSFLSDAYLYLNESLQMIDRNLTTKLSPLAAFKGVPQMEMAALCTYVDGVSSKPSLYSTLQAAVGTNFSKYTTSKQSHKHQATWFACLWHAKARFLVPRAKQKANDQRSKKEKLTAPVVPRRSPNPVLDRPDEV